jgi:ComF family protein
MAVAGPVPPGAPSPHWRYQARQLAWAAVDLVFPPACGGCQRPGWRLCPDCRASLRRPAGPICARCGYPLVGTRTCWLCRSDTHSIDPLAGLRSAAFFEGPLQHAIHKLKYKRDMILADSLALALFGAWRDCGLPRGSVTPVPLSKQRRRERGYNQADLLARALAELARLNYLPRAVERIRHTDSQVGLAAAERRANVAGAFEARRKQAAGRTFILVDDVCTTGATLAACAEALMAAGATAVWGLTLARARFAGGHSAGTGSVHRGMAQSAN